MERRALGNTGLSVSVLGLGTGEWGGPDVDESALARLLDRALDLGLNLVDTAPSYGLSEERLGRLLKPHGDRVLVSTKVGYGVPGVPDWTYECVRRGVDQALDRLGRDRLDIVLLHSCPTEVLEHNGVIDALEHAREQGKMRVVAYSGENEALDKALQDTRLGAVMTSLNVCDQGVLHNGRLAERVQQGLGWLVKRPLANGVWRYPALPGRPDLDEYWHRWQSLASGPLQEPDAMLLRFVTGCPGVACAVAGIRSESHLLKCVRALEPIASDPDTFTRWRTRWAESGGGWPGVI